MIRMHVIKAVATRNFGSYFSSILGYLFITVFCVSTAVMAFNSQFFTANQANLDQLSQSFPLLLLFIIPAITMTAWSDEKKLGTDELLFTLPATELEILLGKFKAVVWVYTVALACSLVNILVLEFLGSPDYWMLASTYFGYWLAGVALLSVGLLASSLTSSATVAFVLGVVFCCVPVFIGSVGEIVQWIFNFFESKSQLYEFKTTMRGLSLSEQLSDFGRGVIPFSSVLYFVLMTALMLYLNLVVICKRRWSSNQTANMTLQYAVRAVSLFVVFVSVLTVISLWPARADFTSEKLFTLSDATYAAFDDLEDETITIQAFISPEVPDVYSETRRRLIGMLREFDRRGGGNITVRQVKVEPFSEEAEEARALGVSPVVVQYERDGKSEEAEIFMGAVIQSTTDTVEIPFFGRGVPIEYELTRSVRTVANDERLTIGVLQTDAEVAGGSGFRPTPEWRILTELRQQFKVMNVDPSDPIAPKFNASDESGDEDSETDAEADKGGLKFDVLLAVMPSSLTEPQMENFLDYVEAGHPTLIFDDPLVYPGRGPITQAPRLPKPSPMAGMMMGRQPPPEPKADGGTLSSLMKILDCGWGYDEVVYDRMKSVPQFESLPPEFVFVSRSGNPKEAFNAEHPVSQDLENVVMMYPGTIPRNGKKRKDITYTPLLQTSAQSGVLDWDTVTDSRQSFMSPTPAFAVAGDPRRFDDPKSHVLAAHIFSEEKDAPVNVVFCADIDMISDIFFLQRMDNTFGVQFDNVAFILNAVDYLAGEESIIRLRSRRPKLRSLKHMETQFREFRSTLNDEAEKAREKQEKELQAAQKLQKEIIDKLDAREDLDAQSRRQLLATKTQQLQRDLSLKEKELAKEANATIRQERLKLKRREQSAQNEVRFFAYLASAILPVCFGMLFLGVRSLSERQSVTPERRRHR